MGLVKITSNFEFWNFPKSSHCFKLGIFENYSGMLKIYRPSCNRKLNKPSLNSNSGVIEIGNLLENVQKTKIFNDNISLTKRPRQQIVEE